jgi:hypothetical protein
MVNYKDFCANNNNIMKNYFKGQFADFYQRSFCMSLAMANE